MVILERSEKFILLEKTEISKVDFLTMVNVSEDAISTPQLRIAKASDLANVADL